MRDDTAKAVKEFGVKTLFNKKSIEEAEKAILPGETVLAIQCSTFEISYPEKKKPDSYSGVFFITDKALYYFCHIEYINANERVPFENITAFNTSSKGILTYLKIDVISRSYSLLVSEKDTKKLYPIIQEGIQKSKLQTVAKPAVKDNDIFAKIEKLADLRDRGILTEEEFQQKKKEWLSEI